MDYTLIVKGDDGEYTAICYEMPSLQATDTNIDDAVLQLVDMIEEAVDEGRNVPEPLEYQEALESVGL